ncbi:SagB/ThcOx family dehydrogenase [Parabacteroides sp. AM08-6]|uniref:SagB/ThcOx family dehydrogenase n=1 Tax=Parabacteroides sp. AM08-6 TaxID=2292053 RepID=UPI000F006D51|nr:SagB/ThcOx family dehydrogenase [Parabacteroides sp. AM08-6]RHJ86734.1 SagB/ThcOx family dehydrogenase [Parabacteroides sp. AM08-6]
MRKLVFISVSLFLIITMQAQELKEVKLNAPDKNRGTAVMKALSERHSDRVFDSKELSLQDLSDLLWAANGINRPDGKRTAPSALNKQDVDVYVILKEGAYLYNAQSHSLTPIAQGDHRAAVAGGQDFVKSAPVCLVLVSDLSRFGGITEQNKLMGAVDAGVVCQNINLFCSGVGLSTVPRASMDKAALKTILKLSDSQQPIMNNPVGYPEK